MPLFRSKAKITGETVRDDFNDIHAVMHYTRAAHFLGLWESERTLIRRHFPDPGVSLLEAGCGAGRATIGLWHEGYRRVTAWVVDPQHASALRRTRVRACLLFGNAQCGHQIAP